jgi:hypothetical protein
MYKQMCEKHRNFYSVFGFVFSLNHLVDSLFLWIFFYSIILLIIDLICCSNVLLCVHIFGFFFTRSYCW